MPYFYLVFLLISLTGLLPPPSVAVQTRAIAFQESDSQDFWPAALAQEQMDTLARIERSHAPLTLTPYLLIYLVGQASRLS
jgi:hypothetical protein